MQQDTSCFGLLSSVVVGVKYWGRLLWRWGGPGPDTLHCVLFRSCRDGAWWEVLSVDVFVLVCVVVLSQSTLAAHLHVGQRDPSGFRPFFKDLSCGTARVLAIARIALAARCVSLRDGCVGRRKVSESGGLWDDCGVLEFSPWGSDLAVGWESPRGADDDVPWMGGCCMSIISTPAETLNSSSQPLTTWDFSIFPAGAFPVLTSVFPALFLSPVETFFCPLVGHSPLPSEDHSSGCIDSHLQPVLLLATFVSYSPGKRGLMVPPPQWLPFSLLTDNIEFSLGLFQPLAWLEVLTLPFKCGDISSKMQIVFWVPSSVWRYSESFFSWYRDFSCWPDTDLSLSWGHRDVLDQITSRTF